MRSIFVVVLGLGLAGCVFPSRDSFAPAPVGADVTTISAARAFEGRIPLVTILPGTTDYAGPIAGVVKQVLAIKASARFDVEAQAPAGVTPDSSAATLAGLSGTAAGVAKAIIADGVQPANVQLTAKTVGMEPEIVIFVK